MTELDMQHVPPLTTQILQLLINQVVRCVTPADRDGDGDSETVGGVASDMAQETGAP